MKGGEGDGQSSGVNFCRKYRCVWGRMVFDKTFQNDHPVLLERKRLHTSKENRVESVQSRSGERDVYFWPKGKALIAAAVMPSATDPRAAME